MSKKKDNLIVEGIYLVLAIAAVYSGYRVIFFSTQPLWANLPPQLIGALAIISVAWAIYEHYFDN